MTMKQREKERETCHMALSAKDGTYGTTLRACQCVCDVYDTAVCLFRVEEPPKMSY